MEGWVKSTDPRSGRTFYANHITRKTQWEAPPGWVDDEDNNGASAGGENGGAGASTGSAISGGWGGGGGGFGSTSGGGMKKPPTTESKPTPPSSRGSDDDLPLPSGWEKMHDKASGRPFYVDHARKVTTWEHPAKSSSGGNRSDDVSSLSSSSYSKRKTGGSASMKKKGFGFMADTGFGSEATSNVYHPPPRKSSAAPISASVYDSLPSTAHVPHSGHSITSSQTTDASYSYYEAHRSTEDALPPLEFKVVQVADELRPSCPSCNVVFSIPLKRRHHCRLCGDVFCHECSNHRCSLPLEGKEFEKPVRVCNDCFLDVDKQNFFTMRRYLTPLQLFDAENRESWGEAGSEEELGPKQCAAALSALTSDLDGVLLDCTTYQEKVTIPPEVLVPAIIRHLHHRSTSDRAVRALSSLLALGNLVGDDSFAQCVYMIGGKEVLDAILALLEWSGSAKKTLAVQEQAARALFYLSDGSIIKGLLNMSSGSEISLKAVEAIKVEQRREEEKDGGEGTTTSSSMKKKKVVVNPAQSVENLDIHRTLRNCLDHTTTSASPSLQRWSAASLRNLITEDQRRSLLAASESAETGGVAPLRYESFTSQLVSSGGVMILCSLIGAEDADTRAHATAALSATIGATRAVDASQAALREMRGEPPSSGKDGSSTSDANIVEAIVSGGGCGSSLAQLLLSADDAVAGMGCSFASSLVTPLLTNPNGSVLMEGGMAQSLPKGDGDGMSPYRDAGVALATEGGCLPALVQLLRDPRTGGPVVRPVELRKCAMETLASVCLAVSYKAGGPDAAPESEEMILARAAVERLEEEQTAQLALGVLSALGSQNLISERDSPTGQLREAAGIVLKAMASCSSSVISFLRSNRSVSALMAAASEEGMMQNSSLTAEWAPRCLGMLEASAIVMYRAWTQSRCKSSSNKSDDEEGNMDPPPLPPPMMKSNSFYGGSDEHLDQYGSDNGVGSSSNTKSNLDLLLEAIDAGAIPLASRVVSSKIEFHDQPKACGSIRAKIACCRLLSAMFGIARSDDTSIGLSRLYNAVDSDLMARSAQGGGGWRGSGGGGGGGGSGHSPGEDLVALTVSLLQSTVSHAQHNLMTGGGDLPLPDLVDASLCAVGSMCGAHIPSSVAKMEDVQLSSDDFGLSPEDDFSSRRHDACTAACDVLVSNNRSNSFLPTVIVGGFGEGSVLSALRLVLAIVQNGPIELHPKMAESGVLIPLSDTLRNAFSAGERYNFSTSLALIRFCGPHISVGSVDSGIMVSLRDSIRILSSVIVIDEEENAEEEHLETLRALKAESLLTLESLSTNASLWGAITSFAIPSIAEFLRINQEWDVKDRRFCAVLCAALRTVQRVIPIPSHAIATARAGMGAALAGLICGAEESFPMDAENPEDDVQELSLEVLHTLASHSTARRGDDQGTVGLVHCGAVDAACFALVSSAMSSGDQQNGTVNGRSERLTKFGLETLHCLLSDLDVTASSTGPPPSKEDLALMQTAFVEAVVRNTDCIKALIATLLVTDDSTMANMNSKTDPVALVYGQPLALYQGPCAGFANPQQAAISALFSSAFFSASETSGAGEPFWETFLMEFEDGPADKNTKQAVAVAASAAFLDILMDEKDGICLPRNLTSQRYYFDVSLPLVRKCLLEGLQSNLSKQLDVPSHSDDEEESTTILPLLRRFAVPGICLALCRDPQLQDKAFQIFEGLVGAFSDEFLPLLNDDKGALIALFNMMSSSSKTEGGSSGKQMRRRITQILGDLTERGLLGPAVEKLKLRDQAIISLSDAFLVDEDFEEEDEEGDEYHLYDPKAFSMLCLESLVSVLSTPLLTSSVKDKEKWTYLKSVRDTTLRMSPAEAKKLSSTIGKKLSNMVLEHFLDHTNEDDLHQDASPQKAIDDAPEVVILCALASSPEALPGLCSNGGLEALSIVAANSEISAITALHEVCKEDPSAVLKVDGHISVMDVLIVEQNESNETSKGANRPVQSACLDVLVTLCGSTKKIRAAIVDADQCERLLAIASDVVCSFVSRLRGHTTESDVPPSDTEAKEEEDAPPPTFDEAVKSIPNKDDSAAEEKKSGSEKDIECDYTLEVSALSLLIELVQTKSCRKTFTENPVLLQACSWLAAHSPSMEMQYVSVNFLANMAPFLSKDESDDEFSISSLATIFCEVLGASSSSKQKARSNAGISATKKVSNSDQQISRNKVLSAAAYGIESIFSAISPLVKSEIISKLSSLFVQIVDNFCGVPRWGGRRAKLEENSALLACSISSLFVLVLGSEVSSDSIQEPELLSAMIRLIMVVRDAEIKSEAKEANEFKDRETWSAVQTHCLFCVSSVARIIVSVDDSGLEEVITKAESVYKSAKQPRSESRRSFLPKKELPRKESGLLTFESVLLAIADSRGNGANAVAAKRILSLLSS